MARFFPLVLSFLLLACTTEKPTAVKKEYLRWVGDIEHDPTLDEADFTLCHGDSNVRQYFNFSQGLKYQGEKAALVGVFRREFQPVPVSESGSIRIRFIVNCQGETGRFRLMAMNENYQPMVFDQRISDQLLGITRNLKGWKILPNPEQAMDYYQYLIFKIEDGQLKHILP